MDKIVSNHKTQRETETGKEIVYRSYKENSLLSGEDLSLSITLHADDFEICHPVGNFHKIHQLCAVYWLLSNLPPGSHSSLSSIFLAILCKTDNVKSFGYNKALDPLISESRSLEVDGILVPRLDKPLKVTVQTVAA